MHGYQFNTLIDFCTLTLAKKHHDMLRARSALRAAALPRRFARSAAALPRQSTTGEDQSFPAAAALPLALALAATAARCDGTELEGRRDPYSGIVCDCADAEGDFAANLDASLAAWRSAGVRGVWLRIPLARAELVPVAASRGFQFHSAEPGHALMTRWLPDTPSPLPPNASHQVGVGSIVVNARNEVLLVQEAVGPAAGKGIWKIPTGLVNAREDVGAAAVRETLEETGLRCTFRKVLAFRHSHAAPQGKSDLFFTVLLAPVDDDQALVLQESEIAAAKWASLAGDLLQQRPYPKDTPLWRLLYELALGPDGKVGDVPGLTRDAFPGRRAGTEDVVYSSRRA